MLVEPLLTHRAHATRARATCGSIRGETGQSADRDLGHRCCGSRVAARTRLRMANGDSVPTDEIHARRPAIARFATQRLGIRRGDADCRLSLGGAHEHATPVGDIFCRSPGCRVPAAWAARDADEPVLRQPRLFVAARCADAAGPLRRSADHGSRRVAEPARLLGRHAAALPARDSGTSRSATTTSRSCCCCCCRACCTDRVRAGPRRRTGARLQVTSLRIVTAFTVAHSVTLGAGGDRNRARAGAADRSRDRGSIVVAGLLNLFPAAGAAGGSGSRSRSASCTDSVSRTRSVKAAPAGLVSCRCWRASTSASSWRSSRSSR